MWLFLGETGLFLQKCFGNTAVVKQYTEKIKIKYLGIYLEKIRLAKIKSQKSE